MTANARGPEFNPRTDPVFLFSFANSGLHV